MKYFKNLSLLLLISLFVIGLTGCGKKEKEPTYVDGNVSVSETSIQETAGVDPNDGILSNEETDILKKAPRNEDGTFDTSSFTKEQLDIYESMFTNKYVDFTDSQANDAVLGFFSSNVSSLGYTETASITFSNSYIEKNENVANLVYSADVQDRKTDFNSVGGVTYYTKPQIRYDTDVYLSRTDNYFYNFWGNSLAELSTISVRDAEMYELFDDLLYIFKNVTDLKVIDATYNGYVCSFTVEPEIMKDSTVLSKQYANTLLRDYGTKVTGKVYINTNNKQIDSVEFEELIVDDDLVEEIETTDDLLEVQESNEEIDEVVYRVTYTFKEYNKNYDYTIESRETAELLEGYYQYLLENQDEANLILNGGTENEVNALLEQKREQQASEENITTNNEE